MKGRQGAWRDEICRVGRSLFERGYVHASAGNISVRLEPEDGGGFLITPTDACLGFLDPATLAHVDDHGQQLSGAPASKTLSLHRCVYEADPSLRCVLHTHSTHLVALTLHGRAWHTDAILPPITPYQVMKVGRVPLIEYHRPGHPAAAEAVRTQLRQAHAAGRSLRAAMLERLGPVVWGVSPAVAMAVLEELEETARLWMLSSGRTPEPLDGAQLAELRRAFGAVW